MNLLVQPHPLTQKELKVKGAYQAISSPTPSLSRKVTYEQT